MKGSRRDFIRGAAAFGAFNVIPAKVLWGATAPSNQLEGGILKYFEETDGAFYDGGCFVFDERRAVGADLAVTPLQAESTDKSGPAD